MREIKDVTQTLSIQDIKKEMEKTARGGSYDPEAAHSYADDLLIKLIEVLNMGLTHSDSSDIVNIVKSYHNVDKWYA